MFDGENGLSNIGFLLGRDESDLNILGLIGGYYTSQRSDDEPRRFLNVAEFEGEVQGDGIDDGVELA